MKTSTMDTPEKKYGWNWKAFIFGGIWGLFHKHYWPFVVQAIPVTVTVILVICFLFDNSSIDYNPESEEPASTGACVLAATFLTLIAVFPIINIIFGWRGNAMIREGNLFRRYDSTALINKRFNWLSFFSAGINLVFTSKRWVGFLSISSITLFMILDIIYHTILINTDFFLVLPVLLYVVTLISGIYGGLSTNKLIAEEGLSDKEIARKYNYCRVISIGWLIGWFWIITFLVMYALG